MRAYGKLETGFWQNPKVRTLTERGRTLLSYVFTCPHGNSVGCFVLHVGYVGADLMWDENTVREHVTELVSKGFIDRDETSSLTRIKGWWGHNTIENVNVAKAALKAMRHLPRCDVFYKSFQELEQTGNKFVNALRDEFADVFRTPNPNPNLSGAEPSPPAALPVDGKTPAPDTSGTAPPRPQTPAPPVSGKPEEPDPRPLIDLFDKIQAEVYGPQRRQMPAGDDAVFARRWLKAGVDLVMLEPLFRSRLAAKRKSGETAIGALRFFDGAVADLIAKANSGGLPKRETRPPRPQAANQKTELEDQMRAAGYAEDSATPKPGEAA